MKVRMIVGVGLALTSVSGCTRVVSEANIPLVPVAAAPTPLVPEAYTVLAAAAIPVPAPAAQIGELPAPAQAPAPASAPPPAAQIHVLPTSAPTPAPLVAARAVPPPASRLDQYHPYWVVEVH
jgi:hypothetical protein